MSIRSPRTTIHGQSGIGMISVSQRNLSAQITGILHNRMGAELLSLYRVVFLDSCLCSEAAYSHPFVRYSTLR